MSYKHTKNNRVSGHRLVDKALNSHRKVPRFAPSVRSSWPRFSQGSVISVQWQNSKLVSNLALDDFLHISYQLPYPHLNQIPEPKIWAKGHNAIQFIFPLKIANRRRTQTFSTYILGQRHSFHLSRECWIYLNFNSNLSTIRYPDIFPKLFLSSQLGKCRDDIFREMKREILKWNKSMIPEFTLVTLKRKIDIIYVNKINNKWLVVYMNDYKVSLPVSSVVLTPCLWLCCRREGGRCQCECDNGEGVGSATCISWFVRYMEKWFTYPESHNIRHQCYHHDRLLPWSVSTECKRDVLQTSPLSTILYLIPIWSIHINLFILVATGWRISECENHPSSLLIKTLLFLPPQPLTLRNVPVCISWCMMVFTIILKS